MTDALYWDDLAVGDAFTSRSQALTRDQIVAFATEFDPQPQHVDETAAAASMFGTLVASGWHTAALSMRLQLDVVLNRFPGGSMGAQVDTLRWIRPVLPGEALHTTTEVMALRPSTSRTDRGWVTIRTTTSNEQGDPVQVMTASVLAPRRT